MSVIRLVPKTPLKLARIVAAFALLAALLACGLDESAPADPSAPASEPATAPEPAAIPTGPFVPAASCDLRSEFHVCEESDQAYLDAVDRETAARGMTRTECVEDHGGTWRTTPCPTGGARPEQCRVVFQGGRQIIRYYASEGPTWQSPTDECDYREESGLGTSELITP
ncbi:MAG: hypothetical protein IT378_19920 [Sandaracinaceae bacterium]|nr:hypothetical protein [Sandaracinaceae bacterium]